MTGSQHQANVNGGFKSVSRLVRTSEFGTEGISNPSAPTPILTRTDSLGSHRCLHREGSLRIGGTLQGVLRADSGSRFSPTRIQLGGTASFDCLGRLGEDRSRCVEVYVAY